MQDKLSIVKISSVNNEQNILFRTSQKTIPLDLSGATCYNTVKEKIIFCPVKGIKKAVTFLSPPACIKAMP